MAALNIGMEGQFYAGAIAATWVGLHVAGLAGVRSRQPVVLPARVLAGALWIAVPVLLKLRFGVLEVISTLLLNFVAEALVSLMVQGPLQEARRIYPQSDLIAASAQLPHLPGARLHAGFLVVILLAVALHLVLFTRTLCGFRLRATGLGPLARAASPGRIDGGPRGGHRAAGLGRDRRARRRDGGERRDLRALPEPVARLRLHRASRWRCSARLSRWRSSATGLLFGALEAGAGAMQREAGVPAVAVYVVEAVVILVVLLADVAVRQHARGWRRDRAAGPLAGFLAAAVRVATPLLLAATGETIAERSGVINLGVEGVMLAGALAATVGATAAGPWTGWCSPSSPACWWPCSSRR